MQFDPTPDQQAFIHRAIASGRYRSADEAVQDAMARWDADERRRVELLAAFDDAESDMRIVRTRRFPVWQTSLSTRRTIVTGPLDGLSPHPTSAA